MPTCTGRTGSRIRRAKCLAACDDAHGASLAAALLSRAMKTLLIMLAILCAPLLIAALWRRRPLHDHAAAGAIGLGLLFLFTASGHFILAEPMAEMLPPWVPARDLLVLVTGLLEIAIAVGLFVPATRRAAGIAAICALIAFFPATIYAAFNFVAMGGHVWGPGYLWLRAPLKAIL
ncbi:MAG: hypothetical protein AB7O45_18370, partial [Alphaproteobacteria bacterium]